MIPKPKFCVGEIVNIRSIFDSSYNADRVTIIKCEYVDKEMSKIYHNIVTGKPVPVGWRYKIAGLGHYGLEQSLRKIPPEETTTWENCEFIPFDMKVKE